MAKYEFINKKSFRVAKPLYEFLEMEALPGSGVGSDTFWEGFSNLVRNYGPINRQVLEKRSSLQKQINIWHQNQNGKKIDLLEYKSFLESIGY